MEPKIIFLSGASSSGKSSLLQALVAGSRSPNVIGLEIDMFFRAMSKETFSEPGNFEKMMPLLLDSFHKAIFSFAKNGFLVIVDSLIQERSWFENYCQNTEPLNTCWVRVYCPIDELNRRELNRGNRKLGLAASQYPKVHLWPEAFDIEIDTSLASAQTCAEKILAAI